MKTKTDINKIIRANKKEIMKRFDVLNIGIFGSYMRNGQSKTSDVDILIQFASGHKDLFNFIRLKNYLQELLGTEVDLVLAESIKPQLREKILNEVQYV